MAWITTSVSLISFGFSTYKSFDHLAQAEQAPVPHSVFGTQQFAIRTLSIGVLALSAAALQHQRSVVMHL